MNGTSHDAHRASSIVRCQYGESVQGTENEQQTKKHRVRKQIADDVKEFGHENADQPMQPT
jgi:hypothetical protein